MKRVDVYSVIREMREQVVEAMQERGIKEISTYLSYKEWGRLQGYSPDDYEEDEDDDCDYIDYKDQEAPYAVYFDKYCAGYDYRVDKVTLKQLESGEPELVFDCYSNELGSDTFGEYDMQFLTRYNVYDTILDLLEIKDEPEETEKETVYVLTYVGLSESERGGDADGYCEAWVFADQAKAEARLHDLRNAEIENSKNEGFDYTIVKDEPMEFRMGWGGGEEVRLQIQDTYME